MYAADPTFQGPRRVGPFADALQDNLELLSELLDAIGAECAQVEERAAALFFEGIATVIEAFSREYFDRGATSAQRADHQGFPLAVVRERTRDSRVDAESKMPQGQ